MDRALAMLSDAAVLRTLHGRGSNSHDEVSAVMKSVFKDFEAQRSSGACCSQKGCDWNQVFSSLNPDSASFTPCCSAFSLNPVVLHSLKYIYIYFFSFNPILIDI